MRLEPANSDLLGGYDLVVDGTDNVETRYLINDTCVRPGLPEVWGSVLQFDAQVTVFRGRPPNGVPAVQLRDLSPPGPHEVPSWGQAGFLGALRATWAQVPLTGAGDAVGASAGPVDAADVATHCETVQHQTGDDELREGGPAELAVLIADESVTLVDVREPAEHRLAAVPGSFPAPFDAVLAGDTGAIPRDSPVVVYCRLGVRSRRAGMALLKAGGPTGNISGGIQAWITQIDSSLPRY